LGGTLRSRPAAGNGRVLEQRTKRKLETDRDRPLELRAINPRGKRIVAFPAGRYAAPDMLNDRSSILSLLETRRSGRPRELVGPAPSAGEIEKILTIAARTPDHGKLFPWRFVTVAEDQREALATLFQRALAEQDPGAGPAHHEAAEQSARHAGALVVLVSAPVHGHKIPVWEQELSCGAAGMNLLLAAHAFGYVGGWITGWQSYSERVRTAFCGPGERIAGFIFIGHPGRELEERPRAPLGTVWRPWIAPPL
jgi:nitroreductase